MPGKQILYQTFYKLKLSSLFFLRKQIILFSATSGALPVSDRIYIELTQHTGETDNGF